jgi:hypothetical protein
MEIINDILQFELINAGQYKLRVATLFMVFLF